MVCRNKDKAEEARAEIIKESGNKVRLWIPTFALKNKLPAVCICNNADFSLYTIKLMYKPKKILLTQIKLKCCPLA